MSDTARSYQPNSPVSSDGLDDFFASEAKEGVLKDSFSPQQGIPVEVAAERLGLSVSGVLKRLRKGSLPGFKIPSRRGEKWLVSPEGLLGRTPLIVEDSFVSGLPEPVIESVFFSNNHTAESFDTELPLTLEDSSEESSAPEKDSSEESSAPEKDSFVPEKDSFVPEKESSIGSVEMALFEDLKFRCAELESKLQAAAWRNGYLESKLEERDQQIKLLTDSQYNQRGWWAKFSSWFLGSR